MDDVEECPTCDAPPKRWEAVAADDSSVYYRCGECEKLFQAPNGDR